LVAGLLTSKYNYKIPAVSRMAIDLFEWLKERWLLILKGSI
jgi:hypothetical protein